MAHRKYAHPRGRASTSLVRKRKRNYGSRGSNKRTKRPRSVIVRGVNFIPDAYMCKLRYSTVVKMSGAFLSEVLYRGNGPYDPKHAAGGGQPYGWDQISPLYTNYVCRGSKVFIRLNALATTAGAGSCMATLNPQVETTGATDLNLLLETGKTRSRLLNISTGRGAQGTISMYRSTRNVYGITKKQNADDDFSALVGTYPVNQWYWRFGVASLDGTTNVNVDAVVEITYYVKFYGRKLQNAS